MGAIHSVVDTTSGYVGAAPHKAKDFTRVAQPKASEGARRGQCIGFRVSVTTFKI